MNKRYFILYYFHLGIRLTAWTFAIVTKPSDCLAKQDHKSPC